MELEVERAERKSGGGGKKWGKIKQDEQGKTKEEGREGQ